ncbi:MAG: kelch repeat-containing protein [Betaproteobacteria bacterium]
MIRNSANDAERIRLRGHTHPETRTAHDLGAVNGATRFRNIKLQLRRSDVQENSLRQYIEDLHNPRSPQFRRWLTAPEFGARFGLASQDINAIKGWLTKHGFEIDVVYPNGILVDFSGTAAQIKAAFRTDMHRYDVDGVQHLANATDPEIPLALAPAIAGVLSLHDFQPAPLFRNRAPPGAGNDRGASTFGRPFSDRLKSEAPAYNTGFGSQVVVPADLAKIYNLDPLFAQGYSGQGQRIAVVGVSNLFDPADFYTFRAAFGLAAAYPAGSLTTVHPGPPSGSNNCTDPGVLPGYAIEANIDAEWASAAAPSAEIVVASCTDFFTAVANLVNSSVPPSIVSISYGQCEASLGPSLNYAYTATYEQAVAQGISVFVAAGDLGAQMCSGIGVNGLASTPHNVAVGGTDFGDSYSGNAQDYWSATNTPVYGSALSYIPEITWNYSCASALNAAAAGFASPYGKDGYCNVAAGSWRPPIAAGGGPSGCGTGTSDSGSIEVSGTCAGHVKPSWQSGAFGIPDNGVRSLPDISLFSSNSVWGRFYAVCFSDTGQGGAACTGEPSSWSGAGGTSFAAPILAGVQALINQKWGGRQGNPNYRYYQLAASQYGAAGNANCNATLGNGTSGNCIFHDVTVGDIDVSCQGVRDCYVEDGPVFIPPTAELFDPIAGSWTSTAMNDRHALGTLTLLSNGKALSAGGYTNLFGSASAAAELYDAQSGTWAATGSLNKDRKGHTATLLADGLVLVAGGMQSTADTIENLFLPQTSLFDPLSGTWTNTGSLNLARWLHTAVLLPNGRVLVAGGRGFTASPDSWGAIPSAELYDVGTSTWSATGSLNVARFGHTATLLQNGLVLVAGGTMNSTPAELYDPATGTWTTTGSLIQFRLGHTATLLSDGRVLVAGGALAFSQGSELGSAEIFDPLTGSWSATDSLQAARSSATASKLADGTILVAGGHGTQGYLSSAERFDPSTGLWNTTGAMNRGRENASAITLPNGRVLVAGGWGVISGVLSTDVNSFQPAYAAGPGWDFATGLGSINAYNLVINWEPRQPVQSLVTASRSGSGSGIVTSSDSTIACGSACAYSYAQGTQLRLTATPQPGSTFVGWLGACIGQNDCVLSIDAAKNVNATFASITSGPFSGDIDKNGTYDALTDGLMIVRYLFGASVASLTTGALGPGATRADLPAVTSYLVDIMPLLDIDGNGRAEVLTDGLLILRYMFGLRGPALLSGVVGVDATRTTPAAIEAAIQVLLP